MVAELHLAVKSYQFNYSCDNSDVVLFSENDKSECCRKYIDIKYLIIREHDKIYFYYISIELMIIDLMTKG